MIGNMPLIIIKVILLLKAQNQFLFVLEILEKKLNSDLISDIKQLNLIWKGSSLKSG